jgi:hypothetical protein
VVGGKKDIIELHFLPSCSTILSAVEYVCRKTNQTVTDNKLSPNVEDLREDIAIRFNRSQGNYASLGTLIPYFA